MKNKSTKKIYFFIFFAFFAKNFLAQANENSPLIKRAEYYMDYQSYETAKDLLTTLLNKEPENFQAMNLYGDILLEENDFLAAEKSYQKSLQINKLQFYPFFKLGFIEEKLCNFPQALLYYQEAEKFKKNSLELNFAYVRCYNTLGKMKKRSFYEKKCLDLVNKNEYSNKLKKAEKYLEEENYPIAKEIALEAIAINPVLEDGYFLLTKIYRQTKNFKMMIFVLENLKAVNQNNLQAVTMLGFLYFENYKNVKNREDYLLHAKWNLERALELEQKNDELKILLENVNRLLDKNN